MRKMIIMLLLLCLLLSGCGGGEAAEQGEETPPASGPEVENGPAAASAQTGGAAEKEGEAGAAPVDLSRMQEQLNETVLSAVDQSPTGLYEATGLRLLSCTVAGVPEGVNTMGSDPDSSVWTYLAGPAGCTRLENCYGQAPLDLIWTDADGDGEQELLYWTYGPTSGLFTVALWAYGLEEDVPVCKANTIWNLPHGAVELQLQDDDLPVFRAVPNRWDSEKGETVPGEEIRIPLRLESGSFVPVNGALPEGISVWGDSVALGTSFPVLEERWAETLVYRSGRCLISRVRTDDGTDVLRAAVSSDGLRVSGYAYRDPQADGFRTAIGFTPICTPEDLPALEGLSTEALIGHLGPPHFDDGCGMHLLGWLTEDGKLLRAAGTDRLFGLTMYDPAADTPVSEVSLLTDPAAAGPDEVFVDLSEPGGVANADRWTAFQKAAAAGKADQITLYLLYPEAADALQLRFDGQQYLLEEEGRQTAYGHLLVSEESTPPPTALYRSATHFLLSDDPEMTFERYFAHLVSSTLDPDFPRTRSLFSIYRYE